MDRGLKLLDDALVDVPEGSDLSGDTAFKLYDTFGFPLDLTQDALREQGRGVDTDGFKAAMDAQPGEIALAASPAPSTADGAALREQAADQLSKQQLEAEAIGKVGPFAARAGPPFQILNLEK